MLSSEFKKKHERLSRTLIAYQAAVDEAAIVSITDLNGKIIYVNNKFVEISKYSAEELIGQNHSIINSGYHSQEFFKEMWQTIRKGKHWRAEIKNRAKDGSYYWVDTVITPVRDKNGRVFQYLSIHNLITIQKEHEEKLIRFQKLLLKKKQQLIDAQRISKTGSWHLDIPGDSLEWSEETYRIFEIPFETPMTYELFLQKVHADDRKKVDDCWQAAIKKGGYEIEHRIVTPHGEKWVSEHARLQFDPSFALTKALGTVQDITEKKKNEHILKESEDLYKTLFNNNPSATALIDKQTLRFLEVNQTAVKLYGYSREDFLQLTLYDIRVQEQHNNLRELVESGNFTRDKSLRAHKKKNGDILYIEPTITEISHKGKQTFLISIHDLTEKIKVEEELALAKISRQKEIDRATIEAEEKSRAEIGRELHDNINQLLVASTMYLAKTKPASDNDKNLLETGRQIIVTAINEIRKLSSLFVPPSLKDISLKEAIEHLALNFKLTSTVVEFDIHMDEEIMSKGLKINIYRIIQEQFNNIIKYAAATKVKVTLTQSDGSLLLQIKDNGNGFDVKQKGKGIGLSNIAHRAEAYYGKVCIESSPGNGCRVNIGFEWPSAAAIARNQHKGKTTVKRR